MTKQQQVVEFFKREVPVGWKLDRHWVDCAVLALDVSPSTVRRAMLTLRGQGILSKSNFLECEWIKPDQVVEIVRADEVGIFVLSDRRILELCAEWKCERLTLVSAFEWAEQSGYIRATLTSVGTMYHVN